MTDIVTRAEIMDKVMESISDTLLNLFFRWNEEKDYEDWKDYETVMKGLDRFFPYDSTVVKTNKRPFGITVKVPDFPYKVQVTVNSRSIGWKSVK